MGLRIGYKNDFHFIILYCHGYQFGAENITFLKISLKIMFITRKNGHKIFQMGLFKNHILHGNQSGMKISVLFFKVSIFGYKIELLL